MTVAIRPPWRRGKVPLRPMHTPAGRLIRQSITGRDEGAFITSHVIESDIRLEVSNSHLLAGRAFWALQHTEPSPGRYRWPRSLVPTAGSGEPHDHDVIHEKRRSPMAASFLAGNWRQDLWRRLRLPRRRCNLQPRCCFRIMLEIQTILQKISQIADVVSDY